MSSISNTLGFAATALLSLGYAVRVAFEHDRRADDERYPVGAAAGPRSDVPSRFLDAATRPSVPAARSRTGARPAAPRLVASA